VIPFVKGGDIMHMKGEREINKRLRNTNKYQRHLDRGNNPKESSFKRSIPKGRYPLSLMSRGET
jgi:hypothetical protein